jgi:hypothetical protein
MFPTIEEMCLLGMSGYKGTNPVAVLECYKVAGTHKDDVMKNPQVQKSPYFLEVMKHDGIQRAPKEHFECETCGFYSLRRKCSCG